MGNNTVKNDLKVVNISYKIPPKMNDLQQRLSVAEDIIASALNIIKVEKILHGDNVLDIQFIIEDFLSSISDNNYDNFIFNYDGDEL